MEILIIIALILAGIGMGMAISNMLHALLRSTSKTQPADSIILDTEALDHDLSDKLHLDNSQTQHVAKIMQALQQLSKQKDNQGPLSEQQVNEIKKTVITEMEVLKQETKNVSPKEFDELQKELQKEIDHLNKHGHHKRQNLFAKLSVLKNNHHADKQPARKMNAH